MSAFNFDGCGCGCSGSDTQDECLKGGLKDECLIAFKVYDFFRIQECLTQDVLGYSRAAEDITLGENGICSGEIIIPPSDAASVTIEDLEISSVNVLNKKKNALRNGYYDVDLQFIFVYNLVFSTVSGCRIAEVPATNTFSTKLTLFGSIDTDVNLSTDLFGGCGCSNTIGLEANPFIWVESKAVALAADLVYPKGGRRETGSNAIAVKATIGLFAIVKLFRIVNLLVASRGFCIPEEIESISSTDPCDFFDSLDFPMDSFAPPQKPEFEAGISSNIPTEVSADESSENSRKKCCCSCDCDC
ncbi:MAG: hypothetical protein LIO87_02115 [Eubacterium sp.]|nr:hypothetical protein [Eubacterium sp.]